ncbi:MAG: His/Gly/Thr/Pro-type tRNA ligase C-terminal domain-containing protein [Flavobacteriaceae bacterium]|nr:His/Gly/Thr/Pro-type tRNA ligase C-terminal domain-containing protein [Flavobacteriaceae bacterium]
MNYANKREIPFVVLVGANELMYKNYTLKNMNSGEQSTLSLEELLQTMKNL